MKSIICGLLVILAITWTQAVPIENSLSTNVKEDNCETCKYYWNVVKDSLVQGAGIIAGEELIIIACSELGFTSEEFCYEIAKKGGVIIQQIGKSIDAEKICVDVKACPSKTFFA